ncbi:MAG: hypothetical protein OEV42_15325 [Deltaproteobacteria bacterium]|nr:hypothetical protein [Deltaproteobacteria bacterium]
MNEAQEKSEIIRIANCIIPRPGDRSIILSIKTMAFNDYSLPGKTMKEDSDIEGFLIESVREKTGISIDAFEEKVYLLSYEKRGQLYERTVLVVSHCEGVPISLGDREKYGIGVFKPDITFTPQWKTKKEYALAPGIYKTLLTYYADLPDLKEKYPEYLPLDPEDVGTICGE